MVFSRDFVYLIGAVGAIGVGELLVLRTSSLQVSLHNRGSVLGHRGNLQ